MIIYCLSYAHDIMIWITRSSDLHSDNIITATTTATATATTTTTTTTTCWSKICVILPFLPTPFSFEALAKEFPWELRCES